jgi:metallo-beta-lactamase family protein
MIFSGDLGAKGKPILPDPDPPDTCDLLFLESTYGDTIHEGREDRILQLGSVLSRALSDGGKVYIPSFALGRTQELIYDLDRLTQVPEFRKKFPLLRPDSKIPIFLDSPLGMKLTEIYTLLHPYWDKEAKQILQSGNNPLDLDQLYTAAKHGEHLKLLEMPGPCIIIAGSGMCTGGRIIDHLKTGLEDPRNDIVFVGYQGEGTLGRQIIEESRKENGFASINGMEVSIKAGVHVLMGYSGHADQNDLVDWVQSMPSLPGMIKLLHGEESAKMALAVRLRSHGYQVN